MTNFPKDTKNSINLFNPTQIHPANHDQTKVSEKEKAPSGARRRPTKGPKGVIRRPAGPGLLRSKSRKGAKAAGFGAAPRSHNTPGEGRHTNPTDVHDEIKSWRIQKEKGKASSDARPGRDFCAAKVGKAQRPRGSGQRPGNTVEMGGVEPPSKQSTRRLSTRLSGH